MTSRWFIDALDPRAGLAVASQREDNLMRDVLTDGGPSVFISPPAFLPEFLDSRTVGFGLARMRAQSGIFLDQVEVPFDSLPAVVEFVRRTYLRGAAGDGPAENGGPPVGPRPVPGDGPTPVETHDSEKPLYAAWRSGKGPVDHLLEFARLAQNTSDGLKNGESAPPPSPVGDAATMGTMPANQADRLALGGFWVLEELVRRRPSPGTEQFMDWLISVNRLIELFSRMGLWFTNRRPFPKSSILLAYVDGPYQGETEQLLRYLVDELLIKRHPGSYYWAYRYCCGGADAFDDLVVLPVPPEMVPFAHSDGQNLQALLSGLVAVPADILSIDGSSETRTRCCEILFFAAAALNLDGETAPHAGGGQSSVFARRLVGRAIAWMDSNLPKRLFSPKVEDLISSASQVPT